MLQGRWYMYIFKLFEKKTESVALDFVKKRFKKIIKITKNTTTMQYAYI